VSNAPSRTSIGLVGFQFLNDVAQIDCQERLGLAPTAGVTPLGIMVELLSHERRLRRRARRKGREYLLMYVPLRGREIIIDAAQPRH
jgi:hypothetical protein